MDASIDSVELNVTGDISGRYNKVGDNAIDDINEFLTSVISNKIGNSMLYFIHRFYYRDMIARMRQHTKQRM